MSLPISVIVPVGPQPEYLQYLEECLESIYQNDPDEVILIDDMAHLDTQWPLLNDYLDKDVMYYQNPWLCGCAMSWNFGVSYSRNEMCFLMGSDDKLMPYCLEGCVNAWETHDKLDGWYNVTCQLPNGDLQDLPNNAAAITKGLWQLTGGFGPSAFAAPDAWLLSIMMVHMPQRIIQVDKGTPYYFVREHKAQDTPRQFGRFFDAAHSIRDIATRTWTPPEWKGWN